MDDEASCRICGRPLTKDERGLNQKILEADAKRGFWRCLTCLAEYLECGEEELDFIVNDDVKYRMGDELAMG